MQLQEEYAGISILGDTDLVGNIATLHDDVDLKTPGNTLSDQTAETKAELQTLTDLKLAYDDITADISTAGTNAENAVSNSAITEGSTETVSSVLDDVNELNLEV